jgi:hypothetical protein
MISAVNPAENLIAARLLDYFSSRTHWHRTLWNAGTILALREVLEASEAQNLGHLSEKSIRGAVTTALRLLQDDPGLGGPNERAALVGALTLNGDPKEEILYKGLEYEQIQELLQRATSLYLERWAEALTEASPPAPERASRAVASHLLDCGFNSNYLHRWWTFRLRVRQPADTPLSELVREASQLANKAETQYSILVPFPSELKPPRDLLPPASWLDSTAVSRWVQTNGLTMPSDLHQQGGLLLTISALDPESAVQLAAERVELFAARVLLSLRKQIQNCGIAWVQGQTKPYYERQCKTRPQSAT